ncbi:hypothetical protein [Methanosphaera cuniculi]|uniref:Uncharacterized protein n=1 Tax=Methanosphaera cuniculi TaxID=1077256 RepID=A0A2V2BSZ7_9EURY|nr:hypothetical protein [Methanosphaera cuniculi]PWL08633.1 hypothetical protein MSCUN_03460 [Methanosphaera cuniculi]
MEKHITLHGKNGEVEIVFSMCNPIPTLKKDFNKLKQLIRIFI